MSPRSSRETTHLPPFESLIEEHGPALLRFCIARVGPARGEDCFQETMLSALRAYEEVREAGAIRSWLFAIAARKAVDSHRARARAPETVENVDDLGASVDPERPEPGLWRRVRSLPTKQGQAVALRYLGDLSHREIAEVMETSEAAARRNVFEGLSRLRGELDEGADLTPGRARASKEA